MLYRFRTAPALLALSFVFYQSSPARAAGRAREILDATGVKGGLVVHVGCGDGKLTAALRAGEGYLVHGLDADAANVAKARRHVRSLGLCGKVAVAQRTGKTLPYADNLVNLLVVADFSASAEAVAMTEMMRVLAPGGVAYVKRQKHVKPRPAGMDDWTHHLYDASGVGAGGDTLVGPPRHIQWDAGPPFGRSHENMSSVSVVVSAGGRVFAIMDDGPKASIYLPSKWSLTARDAFSGVRLWRVEIRKWHAQLFPLKSGPMQVTRRLVASADRVYATLGLYDPVSEIDAATGKVLRTFEGTRYAEELLLADGKLIVLVNDEGRRLPFKGRMPANRPGFSAPGNTIALAARRSVAVIDTAAGKTAWKKPQGGVVPLTIAADAGRIYFLVGPAMRCVDLATGRSVWETKIAAKPPKAQTTHSPTVLVHKDVVYAAVGGKLNAFDAKKGKPLWTAKCATSGYRAPASIFVVNGLIWDVDVRTEPYRPNLAALPRMKTSDVPRKPGVPARRTFVGYDLRTGEVRKTIPIYGEQGYGVMHHRCHIPRASGKYVLTGFPGIEFIDTDTGRVQAHAWIRGACLYGFMPANGLIYAPPHPCACYAQGKLSGFLAVAPASATKRPLTKTNRLTRGPAYSDVSNPQSTIRNPQLDGWPTYRGDAARSGRTRGTIPTKLKMAWETKIGGKLTQCVIAGGKLFVASVDAHTVHALDAAGGKTLWSRTVGGRVDSAPTVCGGRVIFGSRDGYVYSLRAADGELVWRFRAAPVDRRCVSYDQVESVWPVHGSVLVHGGVLYFVAGRSSFLDGGLFLYRLDAATGKQLSVTRVHMLDKSGRQPPVLRLQMAAAMPDVLSCDGKHVFMRHYAFDLVGKSVKQDIDHLFCPTGFLDDTWFRRSYWLYGNVYFGGAQGWATSGNLLPSGRILSIGRDRIYGFGRNYYPPSPGNAHQMYAAGERELLFASKRLNFTKEYKLADVVSPYALKGPRRGRGKRSKRTSASRKPHVVWSTPAKLRVRAMVLAASETLFLAGERGDWITSLDAHEGRLGSVLSAVSTADGRQLTEHKLPAAPVFDGMSAAGGKLYLSLVNGTVQCWSAR